MLTFADFARFRFATFAFSNKIVNAKNAKEMQSSQREEAATKKGIGKPDQSRITNLKSEISHFKFRILDLEMSYLCSLRPLRPLRGFAWRTLRFLFCRAVKDAIFEKENHPVSRGGCHPSFVRRGALAPPIANCRQPSVINHQHLFKEPTAGSTVFSS